MSWLHASTTKGSGSVSFSFVPEKGEHYTVAYREIPGPNGQVAMAVEVMDANQQPVLISTDRSAWPQCE
jgi:hypothetical protein